MKALKQDVADVVNKFTAKKRSSSENKKKIEEDAEAEGNTNQRLLRLSSVETNGESDSAYNPLIKLPAKKSSQRRSSISEFFGSAINTVKEQVVDVTTTADNNEHFLDLQDILDITEDINGDGAYATRGRKSTQLSSRSDRSNTDSVRHNSKRYTSPAFEASKYDFGDEYSFLNEDNQKNAGYLLMKKTGTSKYQRKYLILTRDILLYFEKESDVSDHVATCQGKIKMKDVIRVEQDISSMLKFSLVMKNEVSYDLEAFCEVEADIWCSELSLLVKLKSSPLVEDSDAIDFSIVDRRRQNISSYRRSSLGGIPAVINNLKYPTESMLPTKSGYLEKYNNFFWQKRYFKLKQPGVLLWYNNEGDKEEKKSLQMSRVLAVEQSDEDPCCFDVDIRGKTYHLKAFSAGVAAEWCECISAWSKYYCTVNNKKDSSNPLPLTFSDKHRDSTNSVDYYSSEKSNDIEKGNVVSVKCSPMQMEGPIQIETSSFTGMKWKHAYAVVVSPAILRIMDNRSSREICHINMWDVLSIDFSENKETYCLDIMLKSKVIVIKLESCEDRDMWHDNLTTLANKENINRGLDVHSEIKSSIAKGKRKSFYDLTMETLFPHDDFFSGARLSHRYEQLDSSALTKACHGSDHAESEEDIRNTTEIFVDGKTQYQSSEEKSEVCEENDLLESSVNEMGEGGSDDRCNVNINTGGHFEDVCDNTCTVDLTEGAARKTVEIQPFTNTSRFFRTKTIEGMEETELTELETSPYGDMTIIPSDDKINDNDDKLGEMPTRLKTNSIFKGEFVEDEFVAKIHKRALIRKEAQLPAAWVSDEGLSHRHSMFNDGLDTRTRRSSTVDDRFFIYRNTVSERDDFVKYLKNRSYYDMNQDFWRRHRWYLTAVVCYVTMHVLSVTSFMINETSFKNN